jgi:hypothetical protein
LNIATPKDPYTNPRHIVIYVAALVLGLITFVLAYGLSRVTSLPDITDIFPRQNTAMLVMIDPSSGSATWHNNRIYKSIENKVIEHFTAISKSADWHNENDVLGYALINTPKGLEPVYFTSADFSQTAEVMEINGYFVSARNDLQQLLSPTFDMSLSRDALMANTKHVLPIDQTIRIVIQPELMAASLPQIKTENEDVRAAISLIGPQIAKMPLSIIVFHTSDNNPSITVAMSPTVNLANANLKILNGYSTLAINEPYSFITNGGDLLLASLLTVKHNSGPAFYRQILESNQLVMGVNGSGTLIYARRSLGWAPEREIIIAILKNHIRAQSSWISRFTLPDNTTSEEVLGPKDDEIEVIEENSWITAKYQDYSARAKIDGPDLIMQFGDQTDLSWREPQERTLKALVRDSDITHLIEQVLLPESDDTIGIMLQKIWHDLNIHELEIDAAATESADLIRLRWKEKSP